MNFTWLLLPLALTLGCGASKSDDDDADADKDSDPVVVTPAGCAGLWSHYDLNGASYTGYAQPRDAGDPTSPMTYGLVAALDQGPPQDIFEVQFWNGFGVFSEGVETGTFSIAGDETNLNDCGLCALILGDLAANGATSTVLVAQGGTFQLDEVQLEVGGALRGSATALHFRQVDSGGVIAGGCAVSMDNIAFDVTLETH